MIALLQRKSLAAPSLKRLDTPAEFKFSGKTGSFEGYAARFNNLDSGGDVIEPGAFQEFVKTRDGKTIILYQHSTRDPIGKADVSQDSQGLRVRGELALDDPTAQKAHALMKAGILDGMSVGYDVLPGGAEMMNSGARKLTALKLYECSVVTFGMNDHARIESVKDVTACTHVRELEGMLRKNLNLSSRKAAAAANALWPILSDRDDREDDDRDDRRAVNVKDLVEQIQSLNKFIKGLP